MTSHRRVKDIAYDDHDLYSDDDDDDIYNGAGEEYTAEEKQNFATLTPVVRAHLEEAGLQASDRQIEDALWHYYWDVNKSVDYLTAQQQPSNRKSVQIQESQKQTKSKSKFDQALEKSNNQVKGTTKASQNVATKPALAPSDDPSKAKSQAPLLDAKKLWEQSRKHQKASAAFVVAGHVDHGKSTLMGRLLLDTGAVQQRDIDKYKKQAAEIGKESFALAWVMDTGAEERERGVTVDIAQHFFSTRSADFTILDAPGHRDFIPNMIGGAMMADIVVLVVDANQLDSGLKGQTREHILLAYGVGIHRVVVAVNKLDSSNPPWSQPLFDVVRAKVSGLLTEIGFQEESTIFVPCSGLSGENVVKPVIADSPAARLCSGSPSLIAALQSLAYDDQRIRGSDTTTRTPQEIAVKDFPLRLQVADLYRGGIQNPLSVSGRVLTGAVATGTKLIVEPSQDEVLVKGIQIANQDKDFAAAFEIASLHLDGDIETLNRNLRVGDVLAPSTKPITLVKAISLRIHVLDTILPQTAELHYGRLQVSSSIKRLVSVVNAEGETPKKNPRSLKNGQQAIVEVAFTSPTPLEIGNKVILRADGATIAFGVVEGIFSR